MFVGRPPLFLNDTPADIGELGEPKGGGGNAVNELVMVTICCNGLLFLVGEKEIKGEGPGRGVVGGDDGSSDLLSSSWMLSFSARASRLRS